MASTTNHTLLGASGSDGLALKRSIFQRMKSYALPKNDPESGSSPGQTSDSRRTKVFQCMRANLLILLILSSLVLGIVMGIGIHHRKPPLTAHEIMYFRFPGDLLMNMLKLLILPLIVSSLISGLANLDTRTSGWMGARAIIYYLSTTFMAVILGIVLVVAIRPGNSQKAANMTRSSREMPMVNPADALLDLIRNSFPNNIVVATFQQTRTKMTEVKGMTPAPNTTAPPKKYSYSVGSSSGTNVLGIVVFSIAVGIVISRMGNRASTLKKFFNQFSEVVMVLVNVVIWYSPIGICFLVAAKIIEMTDVATVVAQLGLYSVTVITGLVIHGLIVLPLLYFFIVRKNPFRYMYGVLQAILTALATSSSSATLPVTLRCVEENNLIDQRVTRFVLPIGATINMDGTALYEAVAAIFIAQVNGVSLNIGQIITVSLTATAAAIGAAGVPQAGLVTMVIVLTAVGLPTDDVTLIIAVDWFLDRLRTSINVLGDAIGAGIVYKLSEKELGDLPELDDAPDRVDGADNPAMEHEMQQVK